MFNLYLSALAAFAATSVLIFALRPVARNLDFVDRPGGRKLHDGDVPVVGGLAMFLGLVIGISGLPEDTRPPVSFTATAFVFVCLGLIDDRLNLPSTLRLVIQIGSVIAMAVVGALSVQFVGQPFGTGLTIFTPGIALIITVMLVVGAVNAMNMIDGIDGLAGSVGLVAVIGVSWIALSGSNATVLGIAAVLVSALLGFLLFNLPLGINGRWRVFMGDAGSMLIGFSIAWMMVALSQDPTTPVAPVTLLWLAALPIFDMVSTAFGRLLRGQSPMKADNSHLHHRLMRKGFTARQTLMVLVAFSTLWAALGLALDEIFVLPEWASLVAFLTAGYLTVTVIEGFEDRSRRVSVSTT
jgi:UDP-GlcNAc:undecaprenyl-phosphate GlcNAc-1-phosphate transferase